MFKPIIQENSATNQELHAEIERLEKIITALMNHAERSSSAQGSDFSLLQTAVVLEDEVKHRTEALEAALQETKKITRALRESESKFHHLVEQSLVGITLSDGMKFIYANPKFSAMIGYSQEEILNLGPLDITYKSDHKKIQELISNGLSGRIGPVNFTFHVVRKDGKIIIVEVAGGTPININDKPTLISVWSDITARVDAENEVKILNAELQEQAIKDPLTGLFNRRYMEESFERELIRAKRNGESLSVIMGDLDYFKKVNDTYGHLAGDEVLKKFGELMKQNARGSDIYCRYGGEEFLLILPDISIEKAAQRAEKLRFAMESSPIVFNDLSISVTASFGVSTFPENGDKRDILISEADKALYQAKERGRNQVYICNSDI